MYNDTSKRSARSTRIGAMEFAAWSIGLALIVTFIGARLWLSHSVDSAVASFQDAQRSLVFISATADVREQRSPSIAKQVASSQLNRLTIQEPDTALWSDSQIRAYAAAADRSLPEAILYIGKLDLAVPVYPGVSERNLNRGAAWIEGTSAFHEEGNIGIAAHRDGYFRSLENIRIGDRMEVETLGALTAYRVTDIQVVAPQAVHVLGPTERASLTLVTCYPFYYVGPAPQRFIVRAERIEDQNRSPTKIRQVVAAAP